MLISFVFYSVLLILIPLVAAIITYVFYRKYKATWLVILTTIFATVAIVLTWPLIEFFMQ